MKNLSIRVKLLSIVIITIILVSTIIATKSIYEVNNLTNQTIEEYRQNAFNTSIEELKNYTAFAQNIAKRWSKNLILALICFINFRKN